MSKIICDVCGTRYFSGFLLFFEIVSNAEKLSYVTTTVTTNI